MALTGPVIKAVPWRFIVTDLQTRVTTLLDRVATNRQVVSTLNAPALFTCDVPSDNPEVNILYDPFGEDTDGEPFVSYGNRLVYGFRREAFPSLWKCRFAGIMTINDDDATTDQPYSHLTAVDPWAYLNARPLYSPLMAGVPGGGTEGVVYNDNPPWTGDRIVIDLLSQSWTNDGGFYVDFGPDMPDGGTGHYDGTLQTTDPVAITFQQQDTVGSALTQLASGAHLDLIFEPIYDPFNRPGYTHQLSIYKSPPGAGIQRPSAVFAWDKPGRTLVGIDRLLDGSQIANKVQSFLGDGTLMDLEQNAASIAKYGNWWNLEALPGKATPADAVAFSTSLLLLLQSGRRTITIAPAPEFSPVPFVEYDLGDTVPVWASKRLRAPVGKADTLDLAEQRIYGFTLNIADNNIETVTSMLLSADGQATEELG